MAYQRNAAYQAAMIGRGGRWTRGRGRGDVMGQLEAKADAGDPRAAAICKAIEDCGIPAWRERQIAPGIQAPCDDEMVLPLRPLDGSFTFIAGGPTSKIFSGRPQKPFKGERPMAIVTRNGASATPIIPMIRGGIRVGVAPQVAQIADEALEFYERTAFGARLDMTPAEPGIDIEIEVALIGGVLAGTDTLTCVVKLNGSIWY